MTGDPALLGTFAATWVLYITGHQLADHVTGQTDRQAKGKGAPTPDAVADGANPHAGWGHCLGHVALYHANLLVLFGAAALTLPLHLSWHGLLLGLLFSAGTHAFLDRRWPVRWLLQHTGSASFVRLAGGGLNGMYLADQATHWFCLLCAAVITVRL